MTHIQRILISVILRSSSGVLLLQRRKAYSEFLKNDPDAQVGVGLWELPGGGLDFGESPLGAGVREVSEETGIVIRQTSLRLSACCAYTLHGSGCESHRIHIIYEASLGATPQINCSDEHAAYEWVRDSHAIRDLPMTPEVRDVIISNL